MFSLRPCGLTPFEEDTVRVGVADSVLPLVTLVFGIFRLLVFRFIGLVSSFKEGVLTFFLLNWLWVGVFSVIVIYSSYYSCELLLLFVSFSAEFGLVLRSNIENPFFDYFYWFPFRDIHMPGALSNCFRLCIFLISPYDSSFEVSQPEST